MQLTGGEIVVKQLIKEGVPYVLGIPGHGVLGFFDALRKEDAEGNIKYLQVKHEQTATSIADGYFRVKGEPLAVFASIGPGTLNTCIGLATSYVDSSTFLQICGDTHTHMKGVGVLQEIERYQDSNIIRTLEPLSKRCWRVESIRQLPKIMHRSFNFMTTGRSGPCVVALPMDIQAESIDCELLEPEKGKTNSLPCAEEKYIDKAIAVMEKAKRPVILVGGGALKTKSDKLIVELAEKWGAAIVTTLAGKGAVSETHPQYAFHTGAKGTPIGIEICQKADVVLAVGTRFADETTCSYKKGASFNFPDTKLIHIDIDSAEIGKNYGVDVGIVSDLNSAITSLLSKCTSFETNKSYLQEIKKLRKEWFLYLEEKRKNSNGEITISQVIGKMNKVLPENTIISTSSGNTQAQLFQEYCYKKPYCNLTTGGFSSMGWAFPAAIGAKLASPESPVVAFLGDGDFMMVMQELSTIAQYNIPVVVILTNNSGWMAIRDLQEDVFGKEYTFGNDFLKDNKVYSPDFYNIAKSFGINSYQVKNIDDLDSIIKESINSNKPSFINIDVSREYPYTGGKAFGWWDVPVPSYFEEKNKKYIKEKTKELL